MPSKSTAIIYQTQLFVQYYYCDIINLHVDKKVKVILLTY